MKYQLCITLEGRNCIGNKHVNKCYKQMLFSEVFHEEKIRCFQNVQCQTVNVSKLPERCPFSVVFAASWTFSSKLSGSSEPCLSPSTRNDWIPFSSKTLSGLSSFLDTFESSGESSSTLSSEELRKVFSDPGSA